MNWAIVGRPAVAAGLVTLLPAIGLAQQRMAPLPPDCSVPGSSAINVRQHTAQAASLAVLPLSIGAGAGTLAFLSDGLPKGVANRISIAVPRISVDGRRVLRRRAPTTTAEVRALGAELGARYLLDGDIAGKAGDTRITVSLYETTNGAQVWRRVYVYDSTGVLPVEQAAAMEVASRIAGTLSAGERQRLR